MARQSKGRSRGRPPHIESPSDDESPTSVAFKDHHQVSTWSRLQSFKNSKVCTKTANIAPKDDYPTSPRINEAEQAAWPEEYRQWQEESSRPQYGLRAYNNMPGPWPTSPSAAPPALNRTYPPSQCPGGNLAGQHYPGNFSGQNLGAGPPTRYPASIYPAPRRPAPFISLPQSGNVHPYLSQPHGPPPPRHDL